MAIREFQEAFDRRRGLAPVRPRRSAVAMVGEVAGAIAAHLPRFRTTLLSVGGLGFFCLAAYDVSRPLGFLVTGAALWVLEHLSTPEPERPPSHLE